MRKKHWIQHWEGFAHSPSSELLPYTLPSSMCKIYNTSLQCLKMALAFHWQAPAAGQTTIGRPHNSGDFKNSTVDDEDASIIAELHSAFRTAKAVSAVKWVCPSLYTYSLHPQPMVSSWLMNRMQDRSTRKLILQLDELKQHCNSIINSNTCHYHWVPGKKWLCLNKV